MVRLHASLLGVAAHLGEAAVFQFAKDQNEASLSSIASSETVEMLSAFSETILNPRTADSSNYQSVIRAVSDKMDLKTASKAVESKNLPESVSSLVQTVNSGNGFADFDENSLEKARIVLNDLVFKAWLEMDDKIFECKGFQDMYFANYGQVTRDIMRLIEQINDLERVEAQAIEGIQQKEQEILDVEALLAKETMLYNKDYAANKAELTIRQNDLDVFQFILEFTQCEGATSLSQTKSRVCETRSGRKTILFKSHEVAGKYKKMLTPRAKRSIDQILRAVENTSFVQQPTFSNATTPSPVVDVTEVVGEDGKPCVGATGQVKDGADTPSGVDTGGQGMGDEDECMKMCSPEDAPICCGCLHDKLSLLWGEYKDKVDELTMEMMKNQMRFEELKETLNSQITMLVVAKARFQQLLAEARANLAGDRQELKEKYKQKAKLNKQYWHFMSMCKKKIQEDITGICSFKIVRNAVLENSTVCPSATIQDCDLDAWIKHQCTVSCDDSCNADTPFKCGGWALMTRAVVAQPDNCGIVCPLVQKNLRCGQYKCPINCLMSEWSGWSKCTAECEGGLESHTRNILMKPMHGGESCNTVEESRTCNTMSCDRDCRLQRWTHWTPCSVACQGGFQERFRHVLIPTRGEGKCPKGGSSYRYEKRMCNTQDCTGDEICIAIQDVVLGFDGSGSVTASNFDILKNYGLALIQNYQMQYFGEKAIRMGIMQFGNGVIMPDGKTVSPAINAHKLTSDKDALKAARQSRASSSRKVSQTWPKHSPWLRTCSSKEPESRLSRPSC